MNIRDRLGRLFEFLICGVLRYCGFNVLWVGNRIGGGVDVIAEKAGKKYYFEIKNWKEYDRRLDEHIVKREIVSRFRDVEDGEKFVVFAAEQEFTDNAEELLKENEIKVINLGKKQITWKNWGVCFKRGLKKFGEIFGTIVHVMDFIIDKIRRETFLLVNLITEAEVCDSTDQGGGDGSRVKSGFKSILEGCGKVLDLVKNAARSVGDIGLKVSEYVSEIGWKRFVLDESGQAGLLKIGGESLKKENENLGNLVDELLAKTSDLANAIGELVEAVKLYNGEVNRLSRVSKQVEKMAQGIRKGVRSIRKRYQTKELAKAALEGADMSEIIKTLDNIGKVRRLEKELAELERKSNMGIKEMLEKALAGKLTIGEVDRIQRAGAAKERLKREIRILTEDTGGSAGKKKKVRDEFNLVRVG